MTTVFEQMTTHIINHGDTESCQHINPDDYAQWRQDFIWEALHGQRYGQSFCNRFGIHDNHLFYNTGSVEWADRYIQETYLA